jgi:hypothetical protein
MEWVDAGRYRVGAQGREGDQRVRLRPTQGGAG